MPGGYNGEEDYRWEILRGRMSPITMAVFNLVFVAIIQNILLFALALPAYVALQCTHVEVSLLDALAR